MNIQIKTSYQQEAEKRIAAINNYVNNFNREPNPVIAEREKELTERCRCLMDVYKACVNSPIPICYFDCEYHPNRGECYPNNEFNKEEEAIVFNRTPISLYNANKPLIPDYLEFSQKANSFLVHSIGKISSLSEYMKDINDNEKIELMNRIKSDVDVLEERFYKELDRAIEHFDVIVNEPDLKNNGAVEKDSNENKVVLEAILE